QGERGERAAVTIPATTRPAIPCDCSKSDRISMLALLRQESPHTDVFIARPNDVTPLQRETATTRHGLAEAKVRMALTAVRWFR
ncbi:hypothetical protein JVV04_20125, partial [Vibrio cholerae O1]|uniref:hypothetical protein n=1 Tax=Vibrio cholerae TaxID=666 RepID=UPI001C11692D